MDIADFAEKMFNVKLLEWQKEYIRTLDRLGKDAKIVHRVRRRILINKKLGGEKNEQV